MSDIAIVDKLGKMYTADIASIGEGVTDSTASNTIQVHQYKQIRVVLYSTGENGSIDGTLVVDLVSFCQEDQAWDTEEFAQVVLNQTTNAQERVSKLINVESLDKIRVKQIKNNDASYDALNVNLVVYGGY